MNLNTVEKQRTGLVQFLVILVMLILGFILFISFQQDHGVLIKTLTVAGLAACLYVIAKERSLKRQHDELLEEVVERRGEVDTLDKKIRANRVEVVKLESRLQELTALYRAISTVNAVTDHQDTFDSVLRAALDLVGGDRGSLMLVDSAKKTLPFASAIGLEERILNGPELRIGDGVAGWVAKQAEPVLLTGDIDEDGPFEMMGKQDGEMNVAMSVPLQLGDRVIGVLNLGSSVHAAKQHFSKEELRFAYIFAQHAAIAVDRAKVIDRSRRVRDRNGARDAEIPTTSSTVRARTIEN